jgi:hypothetical protein
VSDPQPRAALRDIAAGVHEILSGAGIPGPVYAHLRFDGGRAWVASLETPLDEDSPGWVEVDAGGPPEPAPAAGQDERMRAQAAGMAAGKGLGSAEPVRGKDVQVGQHWRAYCRRPGCGWSGGLRGTFQQAGDDRMAHLESHRALLAAMREMRGG